jgi:parallel beta-helix repeat protein
MNFSNWTITGCGAGINLSGSASGNYNNNIIREAGNRGAYINTSQYFQLAYNKIVNNGLSSNGAGIYIQSAPNSAIIESNLIRDNTGNNGAGIYVNGTSGNVIIRNNLILENYSTSSSNPGGVYFYQNGTADFYNNTVIDNTAAGTSNTGIGLSIGSTNNNISVHDNIIYNNSDTDSIEEIEDLSAGSSFFNNASSDPAYDTIGGALPGFTQAVYLNPSSAAIDAGSDTAANLGIIGTTQTDGSADTGNVDLGYHYLSAATAVDATNSMAYLDSITTALNVPVTLTIIPMDAGVSIIGAALDVEVSVSIPGHLSKVTDNGDGTYTATYTPITGSGSDTFNVTVNGVLLDDAPGVTW